MAAASKTKNKIVLPGDTVINSVADSEKRLRLGPGLRQDIFKVSDTEPDIVATKCGVLRNEKSSSFWIDNNQKRVIFICEDVLVYSLK